MTAGEHKSLALIYINTLAQIRLEKFKEFCLSKTNGIAHHDCNKLIKPLKNSFN